MALQVRGWGLGGGGAYPVVVLMVQRMGSSFHLEVPWEPAKR